MLYFMFLDWDMLNEAANDVGRLQAAVVFLLIIIIVLIVFWVCTDNENDVLIWRISELEKELNKETIKVEELCIQTISKQIGFDARMDFLESQVKDLQAATSDQMETDNN